MKGNSIIYALLFGIFLFCSLSSCRERPVIHQLFKWQPIGEEADSIIILLEEGYINQLSYCYLDSLVDKLDSLSLIEGKRQISARSAYWRARLNNMVHNDSAITANLNMAIELCDSVRFPYDYMLIKNLRYKKMTESEVDKFKQYMDLLRFCEREQDHLIGAEASIDIGNIHLEIGDYKKALTYYEKADSLYLISGIENYHVKIRLNLALLLMKTGKKEESIEIILSLLDNPIAREDFDFFNSVLNVAYMVTGDTLYLAEAEKKFDERRDYTWGRAPMEVQRIKSKLEGGDFVGALKHSRHLKSLVETTTSPDTKENAYQLLARVYLKNEMQDSAIYYFMRFLSFSDSLKNEQEIVEISNLGNRAEIERFETQMMTHQKIQRLYFIVGILGFAIIALTIIIVLVRKNQTHKLAIERVEHTLERERYKLIASYLAMTEKDNVLQSVLEDIGGMKQKGNIDNEKTTDMETNIRFHLSGRQDWERFKELFDKVHPKFVDIMRTRFPMVSEGDIRLAIYIKSGLSTKQIARMLMLQPDSVKKNRQRLRKRMGLSSDVNLDTLLREIDIYKDTEI